MFLSRNVRLVFASNRCNVIFLFDLILSGNLVEGLHEVESDWLVNRRSNLTGAFINAGYIAGSGTMKSPEPDLSSSSITFPLSVIAELSSPNSVGVWEIVVIVAMM
jgi:hypothetical protein